MGTIPCFSSAQIKKNNEEKVPYLINKKKSARDFDECTVFSENQDGDSPSQPIA